MGLPGLSEILGFWQFGGFCEANILLNSFYQIFPKNLFEPGSRGFFAEKTELFCAQTTEDEPSYPTA